MSGHRGQISPRLHAIADIVRFVRAAVRAARRAL